MTDITAERNARLSATQPARERNIEAIAAHLRAGAKTECKALGIELEHICVDAAGMPISYSQPGGVRDVLEALSAAYPERTEHDGDLLGVARPGAAVTIEPAAQLELSAGPFTDLDEARAAFDGFEADATAALEPVGGKPLAIGFDPKCKTLDKELIPKARYDYMNRYLGAISPWGQRMMRASASTQVSIDYTDEADAVRKMRVAEYLSPVLALICDNAPIFEAAPRPHALMRVEAWEGCDPDRCGVVPGMFDAGFGFDDYAAWLLDTPAIVAIDEAGEATYDERTFGEIYAERAMGDDEVLHAMSMVFPDVRLKSYVEIRPADSMPVPYVIAYAALIKGLFYNEGNLARLAEAAAGVDVDDVTAAKHALMQDAYAAEVYGRPVAEICDQLIELARAGLAAGERRHLDPLAELVAARETLADRGTALA